MSALRPVFVTSRVVSTSTALGLRQAGCCCTQRSFSSYRPLRQHVDASPQSAEQVANPEIKTDLPTISARQPVNDVQHLDRYLLRYPIYTEQELHAVEVVRHKATTIGDKIAFGLVYLARKGFDIVSGYSHSTPEDFAKVAKEQGVDKLSLQQMREAKLVLNPTQWLSRIIFLESIAGVPGMVGGVLRHLRSLRLLKRDGGFIHTLLEEAENERMHLLTFMQIAKPSMLQRLLIFGAQGVFYNLFFLSYLVSPRTCHRYVGCLEEEAVYTYTNAIKELEGGRLPEWENKRAPQIAIDYWRMKEDATMLDLLYAIRADEAGHRFANHTFANVQDHDFNPFSIKEPDAQTQGTLPGFDREKALEWYAKSTKDLHQAQAARSEGS